VTGNLDSFNELANLDDQIQKLEEQQTRLEKEQQRLYQELKKLYSGLMAEFERRWPPLRTSSE